MLEKLTQILLEILSQTGLVGIFFITILESLFAPIPSEVILVYAGFYVKSTGGIPELFLMALIASLGNFVGTLPFYIGAKYARESFLEKFISKWGKFLLISKADIDKVEKFFKSRGVATIFFAKLIPTMRSIIAIPAGLAKVNFRTYTLLSLAGSFIWSLFLGTIGYVSYDQKDAVFAILRPIEGVIVAFVLILIFIYIVKVFFNFRQIQKETR